MELTSGQEVRHIDLGPDRQGAPRRPQEAQLREQLAPLMVGLIHDGPTSESQQVERGERHCGAPGAQARVPRRGPWRRVRRPQAELHAGPLEVVVDGLAPNADLAPAPRPVIGSGHLGGELAAVDQGVQRNPDGVRALAEAWSLVAKADGAIKIEGDYALAEQIMANPEALRPRITWRAPRDGTALGEQARLLEGMNLPAERRRGMPATWGRFQNLAGNGLVLSPAEAGLSDWRRLLGQERLDISLAPDQGSGGSRNERRYQELVRRWADVGIRDL